MGSDQHWCWKPIILYLVITKSLLSTTCCTLAYLTLFFSNNKQSEFIDHFRFLYYTKKNYFKLKYFRKELKKISQWNFLFLTEKSILSYTYRYLRSYLNGIDSIITNVKYVLIQSRYKFPSDDHKSMSRSCWYVILYPFINLYKFGGEVIENPYK
jgi:hypothetical protein